MARCVLGLLLSHVPGLLNRPEVLPAAKRRAIEDAYARAGRLLEARRPDRVILIGNDHLRNFFLDCMPAFTIGLAESYEVPAEKFSSLLNVESRTIESDPDFASFILEFVMNEGFDPAYSGELLTYDETAVPLRMMGVEAGGLVPIFINCVAPPLPSLDRCLMFGASLGRAIDAYPADLRVAVIGSGGISHWIGLPRMGEVNEEFDRMVLERICSGDLASLAKWTDDQLVEIAGNGVLELRNWLAAAAAVGSSRGEVLGYTSAPELVTGIGALALDVGERSNG